MSRPALLDYLVEHEPSFRKQRLPALYSDFVAQKQLNPDGYAANLSAWRRGLSLATRSGLAPQAASKPSSVFILNCDERTLSRAFESKQYGRPLALGEVMKDMVRQGDLIPLQQFLEAEESVYRKKGSWSVWSLGGWVLTKVVGDWTTAKGEFVVLENVEGVGKTVEGGLVRRIGGGAGGEQIGSRFERVFSRAQFGREVNGEGELETELGERDLEVLLRFLSRDKGVLAYDGTTVKVGEAEEGITEEDRSIAQLKELLDGLNHQTRILSKRVEELNATAKMAVAKQNRVAALAALKSKKLAESTLERRFATVNQLEEVAAKLQQASDNVQIVRVMESSSEALKSLTAKAGGVERVEEVVDRLREQMAATDEIGSILAEASGREAIDEGEIDDELAALEGEEKRKTEEKERREKQAREARERERNEERERKEAEDLRRRLEQIGEVPNTQPQQEESAEAMMSRLTLKE
ncbi:vacuolar-sorting protein SNF7 [Cladorrhinum samala]|uniref:Vacuolar-sorting protein SNF7 n=1 Tax=Cladorrhinum samala TaxID=585594 RepID=A0AAV9HGV8_9PEZI|nr:vacuolar-sorting protein SNF7 [Cladorrhinum samala]